MKFEIDADELLCVVVAIVLIVFAFCVGSCEKVRLEHPYKPTQEQKDK